jgi:hypothetical protein
MKDVCKILFATIFVLIALSGSAFGDTWTLTNWGYDGSVSVFPGGFTLVGADVCPYDYPDFCALFGEPPSGSFTSYTFTAARTEDLLYSWTYWSLDIDGEPCDPAGYLLNGVATQLSTFDGYTMEGMYGSQGSLSITLQPGDTFGFYVDSVDSIAGPGEIIVTGGNLPEPTSLALFGTALLGMAAFRRRMT